MSGTWSTVTTIPREIEEEKVLVDLILQVNSNACSCSLEYIIDLALERTESALFYSSKPRQLSFGTKFNYQLHLDIDHPYSRSRHVTLTMNISGNLTYPLTITNTLEEDSELKRDASIGFSKRFDSQATFRSDVEEDCYPILSQILEDCQMVEERNVDSWKEGMNDDTFKGSTQI
ncbi:hypothetical protein TREMEDRAFT_59263 [Tremella mesenterica DSM 1558]|uniref:uncharacterized protein n=1 Tax=Tremella mesenterica (strain ATCC 24925 / CBS 8224 / DSM 1558 / NBRC 9311 / NRRL Y-6157 / RJB 2259-6 / UBC 559-6) TaxID=578456 RepID=UPI0003F49340|nr:uncharacterized protein TREMEDRAFT_59263 [Tremella mesenterica DSM 1558]EIW73101.1 hypothetical protein TREMEDRAFT_59263 [Tremella mesenterica DSM 1558]